MRKILYLITLLLIVGCSNDCTQQAYCSKIATKSTAKTTEDTKVFVCTKEGHTEEIDKKNLEEYIKKGATLGKCGSLSTNGLIYADGKIVEIDCSYKLPFISTDNNGQQWLYERVN